MLVSTAFIHSLLACELFRLFVCYFGLAIILLSAQCRAEIPKGVALVTPVSSSLEILPREILRQILTYLSADLARPLVPDLISNLPEDPNLQNGSRGNLFSCLFTCRSLHIVTIPILYETVTLDSLTKLERFSAQLACHPDLGGLIRTLDLSLLKHADADLIGSFLPRMPFLQNLYGLKGSNDKFNVEVLRCVFLGRLPRLKSLELWNLQPCDELREITASKSLDSIGSLTLRDSSNIHMLQKLLHATPYLQCLDLSSSNVNAKTLSFILPSVQLTHLRLSTNLEIISQLAYLMELRPCMTSRLEMFHFGGPVVSQSPNELDRILFRLPPTLKSLDLGNITITSSLNPTLRRLCMHVEELRIGAGVRLHELERLFVDFPDGPEGEDEEQYHNVGPYRPEEDTKCLRPMTNAVRICKLRRRIGEVKPRSDSALKYLDIRSMDAREQKGLAASVLLGSNLNVIEFSEHVYLEDQASKDVCSWRLRSRRQGYWIEKS